MFPLYKKRDFSDYISDTFMFFRHKGKHFFKLYFTINGGLLLVASTLIYFIFKVYFEFMFSSFSTGVVQQSNSIESLIEGNTATIITLIILGCLLLLFISLLQFAFPVIYLDLLDKTQGESFGVREIFRNLKKNAFKFIKFVIGFIFILFPILAIVMTLNILLCVIIIGFPLLLITIPAITTWIHLVFFHYITGEERFFTAISNAFYNLKQQFWQVVLSTLVLIIILQIVLTIFSMIPYIFGVASIYTNPQGITNQAEGFSVLTIMMTSIMIITFITNYILNNLILVNQGLIYYSLKEHNENISSNNSIDLIGTESE